MQNRSYMAFEASTRKKHTHPKIPSSGDPIRYLIPSKRRVKIQSPFINLEYRRNAWQERLFI